MADKIVVVGDEDLCMGFGLAGVVQTFQTNDAFFAERTLNDLFEKDDIGLIIVYDYLVSEFSPKMKKKLQILTKPVVITVPGRAGADEKAESLQAMIKKAIGVEIKS